VLATKVERAARAVGARSICLAGGVAANGPLRDAIATVGTRLGCGVYLPERALCTDNAAMIAAAAYFRLVTQGPSPLDLAVVPNLALPAETV
jgi:N6-L-threonylcarbamoyladenine synthase